jgi:uncharacterized protein (TIGR02246 family)
MSRTDFEALADTIMGGVEKGDSALMASVHASDAHLLPPDHPRVTGADGIQQFWQGFLDMGVTGLRLETVDLHEEDGLVVEEGRYDVMAGTATVDDGKYVVAYRRSDDGQWRIAIDTWNSDRPVPTS